MIDFDDDDDNDNGNNGDVFQLMCFIVSLFYLLFGTSASIETVIIVINIRYCSKRICSVSFYGHNLFITLHFNVNPNLTPFSTSSPFENHRQHFDRNQNFKKRQRHHKNSSFPFGRCASIQCENAFNVSSFCRAFG